MHRDESPGQKQKEKAPLLTEHHFTIRILDNDIVRWADT